MKTNSRPRNPWPAAIILFFVMVAVGIASFINFAVRQDMDLVRNDYYDFEVRFQQQIDRVARTHAVREQVAVAYNPVANTLGIRLPAVHASRPSQGRINLYRPSNARLDQELALNINGAGEQSFDTRNLQRGLWRIQITWTIDGQEYYYDQAIVIGNQAG